MTAPASAYPRTVDDLMPDARQIEARVGELVPSQRRLMAVLNVGQDKAREIRARLIEEGVQRDIDDRADATPAATPEPADISLAELAPPIRSLVDLYPDADYTAPDVDTQPEPATPPVVGVTPTTEQARVDVDTDATAAPAKAKPVVVWPVWVMLAPAFVSIWAGWVGLGERTGYGLMNLLPGFTNNDGGPLLVINTAITLPIGMEVYGGYALYVWLSGRVPAAARAFAMWSAFISLGVGAAGQIAYHLMVENNVQTTPAWITMAVSCVPVAVLGMGAALAHLVRNGDER